MFASFLFSAPLLFFALFGLLRLCEIGFLAGSAEQASFFAARSEVVGLRGSAAGKWAAITALGGNPRDGNPRGVAVSIRESDGRRSASVSYPARLGWFGRRTSRCPDSVLCGVTAIPPPERIP